MHSENAPSNHPSAMSLQRVLSGRSHTERAEINSLNLFTVFWPLKQVSVR